MTVSASRSTSRRWRTLARLDKWLEPAMVLLGIAWLALLIYEFVWGLTSTAELLSNAIWVVFICEFILRFTLAPRKATFLARNWITLIALGLPALRVLRFARALRLIRATRGLRLVRLLTSMNRGLRSLGRGMQRRGAGYVGALTIAVVLAGAAGMLVFEGRGAQGAFSGFDEALWWTAMLITTLGSDYWPQTTEGRVLTLLLSIYAVGVFGFLAASLTSYFVGKEASDTKSVKHTQALAALHREVVSLREEIARSRMR
jgi:voltage-gated potassium channel